MKLEHYNNRRKRYQLGGDLDPKKTGLPEITIFGKGESNRSSMASYGVSGEVPKIDLRKTKNYSAPPSRNQPTRLSGTKIGNIGQTALQFLPDLINLGTGIFGKDKTKPATRINKQAISKMPERYNINPILQANISNYRSILADPNATMNQKLAAMTMKQRADSQAYGEKINRENAMRSDRAKVEANLDARQAGLDEQHRQDTMASEANLGVTGNFARQSFSNISNKGLQMIAQRNAKEANEKSLAALLSGVSPAVRERILEAINAQ